MPEYIVNLPMQVEADDPSSAVEAFMEGVLANGMRAWAYNVQVSGGGSPPIIVSGVDGSTIETEEAPDEPAKADGPATEPE